MERDALASIGAAMERGARRADAVTTLWACEVYESCGGTSDVARPDSWVVGALSDASLVEVGARAPSSAGSDFSDEFPVYRSIGLGDRHRPGGLSSTLALQHIAGERGVVERELSSGSEPTFLIEESSPDVMVVEASCEESDEADESALESDVTAVGSENELMSTLMGLWRKLRIENAELRAQVQETSLAAVAAANLQLGSGTPPGARSPPPRGLLGGLSPGLSPGLSHGGGSSPPDGDDLGPKRGRDASHSALRPRKHTSEPEALDMDSLRPEELWAMLLREREARDSYRTQMESNARLIEQLRATHAELCRQLDEAYSGQHEAPARIVRRASREKSLWSGAGSAGASQINSRSPSPQPHAAEVAGPHDGPATAAILCVHARPAPLQCFLLLQPQPLRPRGATPGARQCPAPGHRGTRSLVGSPS